MNTLAAALAALALAACAPVAPLADDFAQIRAATHELKAHSADDKPLEGFCSAVAIDQHTLLTAAHCDIGKDIFVNGYRAFIVKKDVKRDLMMLHMPVGVSCPCVPLAFNPKRDQTVYVVGFPLDKGQVLTEGRYESEATDGSALFTAPVTWGNSGGGVFARTPTGKWALVAIVSRGTIVGAGFIPIVVGHLNHGPGYNSIVEFILGEAA